MTTAETSERERDAALAVAIGYDKPEGLERDSEGRWGHYVFATGNFWWFDEKWPPRFHSDAVAMVQLIEGMRAKWRSTHDDNDGEGEHHWSFYSKEVDAAGDAKYWGHGYGPTLMAAVAGAAWAALAKAEEVRGG